MDPSFDSVTNDTIDIERNYFFFYVLFRTSSVFPLHLSYFQPCFRILHNTHCPIRPYGRMFSVSLYRSSGVSICTFVLVKSVHYVSVGTRVTVCSSTLLRLTIQASFCTSKASKLCTCGDTSLGVQHCFPSSVVLVGVLSVLPD